MKLRTVALLARAPGVLILDELIANPGIDLCRVYSHNYLPNAESPLRPGTSMHESIVRPEFPVMREKCQAAGVPFYSDDHNGTGIGQGVGAPWDLLLVCNWRYLLAPHVLESFTHAANIHRGDLPKYPGKRPVRQAIEAGEALFAITAHHMTPELDQGEVIRKAWHQPRIKFGETEDDAEIRIRSELEPFYAPLVRGVIEQLRRKMVA